MKPEKKRLNFFGGIFGNTLGKVRGIIKFYKINKFIEFDVYDADIKNEINIVFNNLIHLINDGHYRRFNSFDYYSKSSKINLIINSLNKIRTYYDLYPNERIRIDNLINVIFKQFKSLESSCNFISEIINEPLHTDRTLFIRIRNFIATEWVLRNIKNNPNASDIKLKDLNYLNYNIEQYQEYLHNCLNFLIRDTKKFISRYPEEYKQNPDLDVEILMSLRNSVYNDLKFITPDKIENFEILNLVDLDKTIEKEPNHIKIRGWFKDKPKANYFDQIKYKAYRRSKVGGSMPSHDLEKKLKTFNLTKIDLD